MVGFVPNWEVGGVRLGLIDAEKILVIGRIAF